MEDITFKMNNTSTCSTSTYYTLATRTSRLLANLIDGGIYVAITVVSMIFFIPFNDDAFIIIPFAVMGSGWLAYAAYTIYLLTVRGQTIGKRMMKIKIVSRETGQNGGFVTNVLLRSVVISLISSVVSIFSIIDIAFIFSEDRDCLHDKIASTKVVEDYENL